MSALSEALRSWLQKKTPAVGAGAQQEKTYVSTTLQTSPRRDNHIPSRANDAGMGHQLSLGRSGDFTPTPDISVSLAARFVRGQSVRFVEIMPVTPEMAAAMLKRNVGNRPIVRARVEKHIQRLRNGTFRLLHQGIAFARDGRLIDGQHRLTAVVEAGITAPFTVTFGAEREEFNCVDQGGTRTAADLLAIDGSPHATLRSSVAAILMVLDRVSLRGAQEVAEYTRRLDSEGDLLARAVVVGNRMKKVTNPSAAALAYYAIGKAGSPRDIIDAFWEGMSSGENLSGARLRLREWLLHDEISERNSRNLTVKRAAVIINAWNSWRQRRKTVDFTWDHTTSLPAVRP